MNREFDSHILNEAGIDKAKKIAAVFDALLESLCPSDVRCGPALCPPGRELSIAKTKLEEACFFAKKAMAIQPENQQNRDKSKP